MLKLVKLVIYLYFMTSHACLKTEMNVKWICGCALQYNAIRTKKKASPLICLLQSLQVVIGRLVYWACLSPT